MIVPLSSLEKFPIDILHQISHLFHGGVSWSTEIVIGINPRENLERVSAESHDDISKETVVEASERNFGKF